ncbi:MAG: metal-dependent hydrolase [Sarcina sp.]
MLGTTHRIGGIAFGAVLPLVIQKYIGGDIHSPFIFVALTMSGGAVGSLIPDIDSVNSTIGRKVKPISKFISDKFGHRGGTHTILSCVLFTLLCIYISKKLETYLSIGVNNEKLIIFSTINAIIVVSSCLFILGTMPSKLRGPLSKKNDIYVIIFLTLSTVFFTLKNTALVISYIHVYILGIILGYISHIILDLFTKEGVPLLRPLIKFRFKLLPFKTGSFIETIFSGLNTIIIFWALTKLFN